MYITTVIIRKEIYIMLLFSDNSKPPERMGRKAKGPSTQYRQPATEGEVFLLGKIFRVFFGNILLIVVY